MKPLNYIVTQKVGTLAELATLTKQERDELKASARKEMEVLGLAITED